MAESAEPQDPEIQNVKEKIRMFEGREKSGERHRHGKSFVSNELRIVLIGKTGCGKSATSNTLLGEKTFESRAAAFSITAKCQSASMKHGMRSVLIVDTPGMFDTEMANEKTSKEVMKCVAISSPGIHSVVLVTRIGRFTKEEQKTVRLFKDVFGENLKDYMMIVFTGKDDLDTDKTSLDAFVEQSSKPLQKLVAECEGRILAVNNKSSLEEKEQFRDDMIDMIDAMVEKNGGRCYTTEMYQRAEAVMKKREKELKVTLGEKTRGEREKIKQELASILHKDNPQLVRMMKKQQRKEEKVDHKRKLQEHKKQLEEITAKLEGLQLSKETDLKKNNEELQRVRYEFEVALDKERQRIQTIEEDAEREQAIEEIENMKTRYEELIDKLTMERAVIRKKHEADLQQVQQQLEDKRMKLDEERKLWGDEMDDGDDSDSADDDDYDSDTDWEENIKGTINRKRFRKLREKLHLLILENEEKARNLARKEVEEEEETGVFGFFKRNWQKFKQFLGGKKE